MITKGFSGRSLSLAIGIGHSTGALLYKGSMAWTLPELEAVCAQLDKPTSVVVAEAEATTRRRKLRVVAGNPAPVSPPPQTPARKVAKRAKRSTGQPEAEPGEA